MKKGIKLTGLGENKTINRHIHSSTRSNFYPDDDFIKNNQIRLDLTYMLNAANGEPFISSDELDSISPQIQEKHNQLKNRQGDCLDNGVPMLGWLNLPDEITKSNLDDIVKAAKNLSKKIDVYLSLGIGGSYLGIEATVKALTHSYFNQLPRDQRGGAPEIYFLGQNLDPDFLRDTLDIVKGKRVGVNVISKSGTTAETAIAFRIIRKLIEAWAGDKTSDFIFATTDKTRGALKKLADDKGYRTFVVPDNIGGRFSVLSDVGLVGLSMAGIDIHEFVAGFRQMKKITDKSEFWRSPALLHAAIRYLAYKKGKKIEVVAANSASIYQLTRWMEQLFPESEGHKGYGLWVSPSMYSEKLHANGQMVQQGERNMIETFIKLRESDNEIPVPPDSENLDGLNYLSDNNRDMNYINQKVIDGPAYAHFKGDVPNMTIDIPRRNAFNIGQFYFMMELSVALSGYMAGHNPFIQPGVEDYKKAMFSMLGKPGTEEYTKLVDEDIKRLKRIVV
jgi:glucose-6-phosphate isomerase